MNNAARPQVVLIHGLWMHGFVLWPLAYRLRKHGFAVATFSYPSVHRTLRENAAALDTFLKTRRAHTVHLVGHSLGGVLIRALFAYFPDQQPGRVVTLASPHQGSEAATYLSRFSFWRVAMGKSVAELIAGVPNGWGNCPREVGTLSGTHRFGLARFAVPSLPRPNDGLLTETEMRWSQACDHRVLSVSHTGILVSKQAADEAAAFLKTGRFK
jgi:pimeloyl-ACP methyl ester carboxylesterase